jgi:hypothetical protein
MLTPDTVENRFFAPLSAAIASERSGQRFSDGEFVRAGILRVAAQSVSGRDFLQLSHGIHDLPIASSTYFDALNSGRRLEMLRLSEANLCEAVVAELRRGDDRLAGIAELAGREVWAGDGHFIEHACHDARILHSDGTMRYTALNTIYMKDLRTGAVRPLELCCGSEHEVRVLQRLNIGELRMGGGKGALLVYDSASVDFGLWYRMRQGSGVYVVSRWKSNLRPVASEPLAVDHSDPRNDGILSDERVEWTGHGKFRKITYRDPESGAIHEYATSDMKLPPGVVALLYRLRWDLEKTFDEFENKLQENKAWACGDEAKRAQALFIAMFHNLMLVFLRRLADEEAIEDTKLDRKHRKALERRRKECGQWGGYINTWAAAFRRATQCSLQFIRWLRHQFIRKTSYRQSLTQLRPLMESYL